MVEPMIFARVRTVRHAHDEYNTKREQNTYTPEENRPRHGVLVQVREDIKCVSNATRLSGTSERIIGKFLRKAW
jgi:hypothetical protein